MNAITYPCWDGSQTMLVKGDPGVIFAHTWSTGFDDKTILLEEKLRRYA